MDRGNYTDRLQAAYKALRIMDIEMETIPYEKCITGFEDEPIVSLEEAVKPLWKILPAVDTFAYAAKQLCTKPPPDGLTVDESASIMLYSMGWQPLTECVFHALNTAIGSAQFEDIGAWYPYLKLFLTALSRLPPIQRTVYRSADAAIVEFYSGEKSFCWRGFTACSNWRDAFQPVYTASDVKNRAIFSIRAKTVRDISKHCYLSKEDEFIFLPGTTFINYGCTYQSENECVLKVEEYGSTALFNYKFFGKHKQQNDGYQTSKVPFLFLDEKLAVVIPEMQEIDPDFARYIEEHASKKERPQETTATDSLATVHVDITTKKKWTQNAETVAGGVGDGREVNQLRSPSSIYLHDDRTLYIVDGDNHRIVAWKPKSTSGEIIAGGHDSKDVYRLHKPVDIVYDKATRRFIIADLGNKRVVQWSIGDTDGKSFIDNVRCTALATDNHGYLYVGDEEDGSVRRWTMNTNDETKKEKSGLVFFLDSERNEARSFETNQSDRVTVAGGHGRGKGLSQLSSPNRIFVDNDQTIYVSDRDNHRVMKWTKDAREGVVVAGGHGQGDSLKHVSDPQGIFVDRSGDVYVADAINNRVVCWPKNAEQGYVVVGDKGEGAQADQLYSPQDITFDQEGNLYVVDSRNHRIQKFNLDKN